MALVLIGLRGELGEVLIRRLVEQDDEVRVVEEDKELADRWRSLGAQTAQGLPEDADLLERASQHARTVVVINVPTRPLKQTIDAVLHVAMRSKNPIRLVVLSGKHDRALARTLAQSGLEYVWLRTPRPHRVSRGSSLSYEKVAEAIDAADDIAGAPNLELDLTDAGAWAALGLAPP